MALWLPQRRDVVTFAGVFGLLGAVYLLPPDTALRQVRAAGALRVCLPPSYPPLVTGDPAAPGIDVELLQAIARDLGVRLVTVVEPRDGQGLQSAGLAHHPGAVRCARRRRGRVRDDALVPGHHAGLRDDRLGVAFPAPRARTCKVGGSAFWSGCPASIGSRWRPGCAAAKAQVTVTLDATELVQGLQGRPLRCRRHGTPAGRRTGGAARMVCGLDAGGARSLPGRAGAVEGRSDIEARDRGRDGSVCSAAAQMAAIMARYVPGAFSRSGTTSRDDRLGRGE